MATLAEARLKACRLWPYGTTAILSLVPVESEQVDVMAVDAHWRIYYRPSELAKLSVPEAATIVLHEVSHLLLKHHSRARYVVPMEHTQQDWKRWNEATDLAVNSMLIEEGQRLPAGVLLPGQGSFAEFERGLSAEMYYRKLREREKEQQEQGDQSNGDDQCDSNSGTTNQDQDTTSTGDQSTAEQSSNAGAGSGGSEGDTSAPAESTTGTPISSPTTYSASGSTTSPSSAGQTPPESVTGGSCADGIQRPWELGEISDEAPGLEQHEAEAVIREVAEKVQKQRGTGAGSMSGWAQEILQPKLDPRAALMRVVRRAVEVTAGTGDYSYRRPNRRQVGDVIRPANVQPVPKITVIVDTSGSMDERDLGLSLGLIGKVLNGFRLRDGIRVICWDAGLQSAGKVFSPKQIELAGRGGTDMAEAIEHVAQEQGRLKPELIVVATDGLTGWPSEPVGVPVVACITNESTIESVPKWINTVCLS